MSSLHSGTTFTGGAQQQPPSSAQRQRRIRLLKRLCVYLTEFLISFLIAALFIGALTLIIALVVHPRPPKLSVIAAAVSVNKTAAADVRAACNLSIMAYNPNTYRNILYRTIEVALLYGSDEVLMDTKLAPMNQSRHTHRVVTAEFVSNETSVGNDVVERLLSEVRHGVVSFRVRFLATVVFGRGSWRTGTHLFRAYCDDIHIAFPNNNQIGTMLDPSTGCKFLAN